MARNDDSFDNMTKERLAKRASFICSNPRCRNLTLSPSNQNMEDFEYIGEAAHITSDSDTGPRYDRELTSEERRSMENGIFLCSNCHKRIDKNNGRGYSVSTLKLWKTEHEQWVKQNINRSYPETTVIDGSHTARGVGTVTAIKVSKPTKFMPGTKSVAEGFGTITATQIG